MLSRQRPAHPVSIFQLLCMRQLVVALHPSAPINVVYVAADSIVHRDRQLARTALLAAPMWILIQRRFVASVLQEQLQNWIV